MFSFGPRHSASFCRYDSSALNWLSVLLYAFSSSWILSMMLVMTLLVLRFEVDFVICLHWLNILSCASVLIDLSGIIRFTIGAWHTSAWKYLPNIFARLIVFGELKV